MILVISPNITLTDEVPQAAHGNPVALLTLGEFSILAAPNTPVRLTTGWTTPASYVMNWLETATPTLDDRQFASRFINPTWTTPAP